MKKTLKEAIMILLLIIFGITGMNAQILVSEDFENVTEQIPAGWEVAFGDENYPFDLSTVEELGGLGLSCSGDKAFLTALESNMIPSSFIITPSYTNGNSDPVVVSFKFKVLGYPDFEPITFDFGSVNTLYSTNGGISWTELGSINSTNFNSTAICSTINYVIPENILSTSSEFKIKWEMNCTAGFIMIVIDDLSFSQTVVCHPPVELTVNNISTSSATLEWQSDGDVFDIEYGLTGFTPGEGIIISGVDNSYILSGLTPGINYQYYVRRDCGGGNESFWVGPFGFTTSCDPVDFFTEDFDSYNTGNIVPDCWNRIVSGTGTQGIVSTTPTASGNRQIHQQSSNTSNSSIIILPQVSNINAGTHWLRFKARVSSGAGNLQVGYITDITDASTFVEVASLSIANTDYTSDESEYIVPFFSDTPSNARIAIKNPGLSTVSHFWDDVHWEEATSCMHPLGLSTTNISQSSTNLNWNSDGIVFDIQYGISGFVLEEGITISEVSKPYVLTDLTAGNTYQYYVRQNCGEDEYSIWSGPFEFTVGSYNFGNIPTMLNSNPQVDDSSCAPEAILSIEVPQGQYLSALTVKYTMISVNPYWTSQQRSLLYSPTLGFGESEIVTAGALSQDFPGLVNYNREVNFANGYTGTIEFQLKAWRTEGGADCNTTYSYVINGTWILIPEFEDIPTCINPPAELGYTNITEDSVDLVWAAEEGAFEIQWGIPGFDVEVSEGTIISGITTTSYTLNDLDSSIAYEFYVRRDCSSDDNEDYGDWIGPFTFNSGYCIPTSTLVYYISSFVTTGGIDNIDHTTSPNLLGYINHSDMFISQSSGSSFNFSTNFPAGNNGVRIWVDWNKDFVFGDDEEVFYEGGASSTKTGTITIPEGTISGDYTIRLRTAFGSNSVPSACGNIASGQALDFTLNVTCNEVSTPIGESTQQFTQGDTLADLDVTGNNLIWYANVDLTDVLEDDTLLTDATTYYVVSVDGNCQSDVLAVTVNEVLSTKDFTKFGFGYQPNPVSEVLYLKSNTEISEVVVFNMLGQQLNVSTQSNNTQLNMTGLPSGNYVIRVTIEGTNNTFKIVKQ